MSTERTGITPIPSKTSSRRRTQIRRERSDVRRLALGIWRSPGFGWGLVIGSVFALVCAVFTIWSREQPMLAVGRLATETSLVRVPFSVEDTERTAQARLEARARSVRVLVVDDAAIERVIGEVRSLPRVLSSAQSIDEVTAETKRAFAITEDRLEALRAEAIAGEPSAAWLGRVASLREQLERHPLLTRDAWQQAVRLGPGGAMELRVLGRTARVDASAAINAADEAMVRDRLSALARQAGFSGPALDAVIARLTKDVVPTFQLDSALTATRQDEAAMAVTPVAREVFRGQPIVERGVPITPAQIEDFRAEMHEWKRQAPTAAVWAPRVSVLMALAMITIVIGAYVALYSPRIRASPDRMLGLAVLLAGALALACVGAVATPHLRALLSPASSVFVAVLMGIAYDRRAAMGVGVFHAILVAIATRAGMGEFATAIVGVVVATWNLAQVRGRQTLLRASVWTGLALALATAGLAFLDRPAHAMSVTHVGIDAGLALIGGLVVGATVLFLLSGIERTFDITTGMTLIELRDPKHPLLRQLQQRAPGTYNHSLNVATIAETAANAIGADPLLTYVGSLYHDVGKMNKPEYFVENQSGGPNRHDKLSPAMSLLVIVGHVKDGIELAREFGLPKPLHAFIEGHHGTTLVEYFYHRARQRARDKAAESGEAEPTEPEEIEYRYPGPRPPSREVAILMLADAVESATRTLTEPTPGRIDALVREIANKRLLDGQFDECNLTLSELHAIVESISRSVASIYHGRIQYPTERRSAS